MAGYYKCSECGKSVYVELPSLWKYKCTTVEYVRSSRHLVQCDYTCYDHALLRVGKRTYLDPDKYVDYVKRSEARMKSQGKEVLHPIKINE